jgi:hypothetical protein
VLSKIFKNWGRRKYTESRCYDQEGLFEDTNKRRIIDDGYKDSSSTYF